MSRSGREQLIYLLAIFFAVAPFAGALVRALHTGGDFRYLWLASASFFATSAVMVIGKARSREPNGAITLSIAVLIVVGLVAGATAIVLGGRPGLGVLVVAFAFGLSWAVSCALYILSRHREHLK